MVYVSFVENEITFLTSQKSLDIILENDNIFIKFLSHTLFRQTDFINSDIKIETR